MMKMFIIERDLEEKGNLTREELDRIIETSKKTLQGMHHSYRWVETYVTQGKMYCIHIAENEREIRQHAERSGFPLNKIQEVYTIIGPK